MSPISTVLLRSIGPILSWTVRGSVATALIACSKPTPDCQDTIASLVQHVPLALTAQQTAISSCTKQPFSPVLRQCLAAAGSEAALQACVAKEPSFADAIKRLDTATRGAEAWTPAKQAELEKLQSAQAALLLEMENAYDAMVDAKSETEEDAWRAALAELRTKHNAMDAPIATAKAAKATAQAESDARKTLCGENPLLAGCH